MFDGIKDKTAQLEHFERELNMRHAELDGWIEEKRVRFASVAAQKAKISMNRPPLNFVGLPTPSSTSRGRTTSADNHLQVHRNAKASILNFSFTETQGDIP